MSIQQAPQEEIIVLRNNCKTVLLRIIPNDIVACGHQAEGTDMRRVRIDVRERHYEPIRQILIEEQLHADGITINRRARSAAKARHARISSSVSSGKSSRIPSTDIPAAR